MTTLLSRREFSPSFEFSPILHPLPMMLFCPISTPSSITTFSPTDTPFAILALSATLAVGGETRQIALSALAVQWSGNYTVLWRTPPQAHQSIQYGARGPAVAWLSQQLASGSGGAAQTTGDPVFDDALVRRVREFQLAQGLIPDGIVGPQTLMRLSIVSDQSAPKLTREQAKE